MKRIEEFDISPWPWKADLTVDDDSWVEDAKSNDILRLGKYGRRNTNLIAAAPNMYKTEYDLVNVIERLMNGWAGTCATPSQDEVVAAIEAAKNALAKAAGEEVSNV